MKQLLWNFAKLAWTVVAVVGYIFYFKGSMGVAATIVWIALASVTLAAVYAFLSAYRLGPSTELGEFLSKSEVAEFNPNQWLFRAWVVLSLGIILPAYHYQPVWVIVAPALLAGSLILTIAIMATLGRHYHRVI